MKVIDVYEQYFAADCMYNDMLRKAVIVTLMATSDEGNVKYEVNLNFFPYTDPTDFVETFDAFGNKELYSAKGRRSKKREVKFLEEIKTHADEVASGMGGIIYWDKPLGPAKYA